MAERISESRRKTKADCGEDSAGEENDEAGGNCGHGFVSYFGTGESYHRAACFCRWRLRASRPRFDVRKDSDSEWRKDRRRAHEIESHPAAGLAGGDGSIAGHASHFGKDYADSFGRGGEPAAKNFRCAGRRSRSPHAMVARGALRDVYPLRTLQRAGAPRMGDGKRRHSCGRIRATGETL